VGRRHAWGPTKSAPRQDLHRLALAEYDGTNEIPRGTKSTSGWTRTRVGGSRTFASSGGPGRARRQKRLDGGVDGETRNAVASLNLIEIVRSEPAFEVTGSSGIGGRGDGEIATARGSPGRSWSAPRRSPRAGVELVDVVQAHQLHESVQQSSSSGSRREAHRRASRSEAGAGRRSAAREHDVRPRARWATSRQELKGRADARQPRSTRSLRSRPRPLRVHEVDGTLPGGPGKAATVILHRLELLKYLKDSKGR
jgi:hypothetical protein